MQLAELADPFDTKERIMIILSKNGNLTDLVRVSTSVTCFHRKMHCYFHLKWLLRTSYKLSPPLILITFVSYSYCRVYN